VQARLAVPWSKLIGLARVAFGRPDRHGTISKDLFRAFLPSDPVIVEAGAHIGTDTLEMSRLWPKGHIHAFEPLPDLYRSLVARAGRRPNVTCYPLALGDRVGTAGMFVSGGASNGSSSLLKPTGHLQEHPDVSFGQTTPVSVTTLDAWATSNGIQRTDLLWLDMQGGELRALEAAPRLLATARLVYMEVSLVELYAGGPLYPEVRQWMERRGFRVLYEALPWPDGGNVLFGRAGS
jgi:FkbM family methyltransferase